MGTVLDYALGMPSEAFFGALGLLFVVASILQAFAPRDENPLSEAPRRPRKAVRGPSDPERLQPPESP
jgi:hypothetical protein